MSDAEQLFGSVAAQSQMSPDADHRTLRNDQPGLFQRIRHPPGILRPVRFRWELPGPDGDARRAPTDAGDRPGHSGLRRPVSAGRSRPDHAPALFGQATFQASRDLHVSGGGRFEQEAGYGDPDGDPTETRNNGGVFVEGRGRSASRVYISAGIGVEHNAAFDTAYTPRLSVAAYLRNPSQGRSARPS